MAVDPALPMPERNAIFQQAFEMDPPNCTDGVAWPNWTCIEYDGTGLWCDNCLAWAERHGLNEGDIIDVSRLEREAET